MSDNVSNMVKDVSASTSDSNLVLPPVHASFNSNVASSSTASLMFDESLAVVLSPQSPAQYNTVRDFDLLEENSWTLVEHKKRGKHPRKLFRC